MTQVMKATDDDGLADIGWVADGQCVVRLRDDSLIAQTKYAFLMGELMGRNVQLP